MHYINLPTNDDVFENLCLRISEHYFNDKDAYRLGRRGQWQSGVDILAKCGNSKNRVAIQCKVRSNKNITTKELEKDFMDAVKIKENPISEFYLMTTGLRDAKIQIHAEILSNRDLGDNRKVKVFVWFADTLKAKIYAYKQIHPEFGDFIYFSRNRVQDFLQNPGMFNKIYNQVETNIGLYSVQNFTSNDQSEFRKIINDLIDIQGPTFVKKYLDKKWNDNTLQKTPEEFYDIALCLFNCENNLDNNLEAQYWMEQVINYCVKKDKILEYSIILSFLKKEYDKVIVLSEIAFKGMQSSIDISVLTFQSAVNAERKIDLYKIIPDEHLNECMVMLAEINYLRSINEDNKWYEVAKNGIELFPDEIQFQYMYLEYELYEIMTSRSYNKTGILNVKNKKKCLSILKKMKNILFQEKLWNSFTLGVLSMVINSYLNIKEYDLAINFNNEIHNYLKDNNININEITERIEHIDYTDSIHYLKYLTDINYDGIHPWGEEPRNRFEFFINVMTDLKFEKLDNIMNYTEEVFDLLPKEELELFKTLKFIGMNQMQSNYSEMSSEFIQNSVCPRSLLYISKYSCNETISNLALEKACELLEKYSHIAAYNMVFKYLLRDKRHIALLKRIFRPDHKRVTLEESIAYLYMLAYDTEYTLSMFLTEYDKVVNNYGISKKTIYCKIYAANFKNDISSYILFLKESLTLKDKNVLDLIELMRVVECYRDKYDVYDEIKEYNICDMEGDEQSKNFAYFFRSKYVNEIKDAKFILDRAYRLTLCNMNNFEKKNKYLNYYINIYDNLLVSYPSLIIDGTVNNNSIITLQYSDDSVITYKTFFETDNAFLFPVLNEKLSSLLIGKSENQYIIDNDICICSITSSYSWLFDYSKEHINSTLRMREINV